ncbi:MAG: aldose 1-epimerase family protein, partial [bacterium]|nr:aldose 1-epimerase family protein [bacterium]
VQFETGTGLAFQVLPSRGLDIASAKFQGASLALEMPTGEAHPAFFDPRGIEWLRTFHVGLVTTCGLTWAGAPCQDAGQDLGLHGRYSHLPARNLKISDEWVEDDRVLSVSGDLREAYLFGPNLAATRTISTVVGSNTMVIEDTIRNEGFQDTPHQLLYHINIGFPVVSETAQFLAKSTATPRDAIAEPGLTQCRAFEAPSAGYKEQVFYHDIKADDEGFAHVAIVNPDFNEGQGLGIYLRYRQKELPRFAQWKNMLAGAYVCGLEPANCSVQGRAHDRAEGRLQFLAPGEERKTYLELTVLPDNDTIQGVMEILGGM